MVPEIRRIEEFKKKLAESSEFEDTTIFPILDWPNKVGYALDATTELQTDTEFLLCESIWKKHYGFDEEESLWN